MPKSLELLNELEVQRVSSADEEGFGSLATGRGCLPLEAMQVHARIDGLLSSLTVCQTFVNGHDEPLEATYIFPLPDRAAVTGFRLQVGERVIESEIRERAAARKEYEQALEAGHRAAITEENRSGVFSVRVGNLMPGDKALVRLSLIGPLVYSDGQATFRFPLVVAPRYIPGTPLPAPAAGGGVAADTDAVPDASCITPPVLLPGFPNPVKLSLEVELHPSPIALGEARSSLHAVAEDIDQGVRRISLHAGQRLDRDFILRFSVAAEAVQTALTVRPDPEGAEGTFLLTVVPPAVKPGAIRPRDIVIVLDRSGSMGGWKMVTARRAAARMVDTLTDQDRFLVLAFNNSTESPPGFSTSSLLPASDRHRYRAVEFLARLEASGGTEMAGPLDLAVKALGEETAARQKVLVLVTDGQVGNEDQILASLGAGLQDIQIFTLGIDQAVNEGFLRRLACLGGGFCELVESEDRLDEVLDKVHRRIGRPVLSNLRLEPAGLRYAPETVVPSRLPDLFADTPLIIAGRYRGTAGGLHLLAREATGEEWSQTVSAAAGHNPAATSVWARGRIRDLEDRYAVGNDNRGKLEMEIVDTSLRFGVLSRFTAFVAVDKSEVVNAGGKQHRIVQPVELPGGWEQPAESAVLGRASGVMAAPAQMAMASANRGPLSFRKRSQSGAVAQSFSDSYMLDEGPDDATPRVALLRLDLGGYHRRVAGWLEEAGDIKTVLLADLLRKLAQWVVRLEELVADLHSVGAASEVRPLETLLADLRTLLGESRPGEPEVRDFAQRIVKTLREFAGGSGKSPTVRRERFWA